MAHEECTALADAISEAFYDEDNEMNVVDALAGIKRALRDLGNGDAATSMGGMEALGKAVLDSSQTIASAISELAAAVDRLAERDN
jgi:hypothetical protein